MEIMMRPAVVAVCVFLLFAVQTNAVYASKLMENRAKADQYYLKQDYKKAYRIYYKLAREGDHHSQNKIAMIYANGEGKSVDLTEAYAWSVLAAQGGQEEFLKSRDDLLQQIDNKNRARGKAQDLKEKYGNDALVEKQANRSSNTRSNRCTGSRLACK